MNLFNQNFAYVSVLEIGGSSDDGIDVITFLYQLVRGMASKSYGLNVAKLAKIPQPIIKMAAGKSRELETAVVAAR